MLRSWIPLASVFLAGLLAGFILAFLLLPSYLGCELDESAYTLPEDLAKVFERLRFVNAFTGETLREFRVIGAAAGSYETGGEVYETYVLGFEDRPRGSSADQDYLDVMVELKRAQGSPSVTVRIVQLGYDKIDVYLDGDYLGSIRPALELRIDLSADR